MCGEGAREGGNNWSRGPPAACALFLRLCNAHRRKRRIGYHEYETHFSTWFANMANDDVGIRATDITLGLGRLPCGFYTVVHHSGLEWRTGSKRCSVNDDVVDWCGPIPM
jgi:hypothetical protein